MTETGERLARIEEGIKGLGRSIDSLRDAFEAHVEDEKDTLARLQAMEVKQAKAEGALTGSRWLLGTIVAGLTGISLYLGFKH